MNNTTTKHTPGPWQPSKSRTNPYAVHAPGGQTRRSSIASVTLYDDCHDEAEANARLIAAAPAMLEVLQRVADHFEDTDAPLGILAHAAIEQATTGDGTTVIG